MGVIRVPSTQFPHVGIRRNLDGQNKMTSLGLPESTARMGFVDVGDDDRRFVTWGNRTKGTPSSSRGLFPQIGLVVQFDRVFKVQPRLHIRAVRHLSQRE